MSVNKDNPQSTNTYFQWGPVGGRWGYLKAQDDMWLFYEIYDKQKEKNKYTYTYILIHYKCWKKISKQQ